MWVIAFWSLAISTNAFSVELNSPDVVGKSYVTNAKTDVARSVGGDTVSNNADDVRFYLFSDPSNTSQAQEILFRNEDSLKASSFDCYKVSKILVHGFTQNGLMNESYPADVKIEYLKQYPVTGYNIVTVDWGKLATCTDPSSYHCYPFALENVKVAGQRIGQFILWLHERCGRNFFDLVHLVGHSLGAHVSGYAGKFVTNATNYKIGRITGLDPAGPGFDSLDTAARKMRPTDANFTDVYHTCVGALGTTRILGQVDFFVNGGFIQPGCQNANAVETAICSHARSHEYYARSVALGDLAKNSDARACACNFVNNSVISPDCCDRKLFYGEYCQPGTAGTYSVKYPPPY